MKYWIITILFFLINSYIFFSDKNCAVKITDLKPQEIIQNKLQKKDKNITTLVYQRSIIVVKETLFNHTLGWGIDGMDNANKDLLNNYVDCDYAACNHSIPNNVNGNYDNNASYWPLFHLNLKDGLSNSLKLFTEFGIFAFVLYFYFLKYIVSLKVINSYSLFIIILFITMSIRGAGYFSGGFIFCIFEFFYFQNRIKKI